MQPSIGSNIKNLEIGVQAGYISIHLDVPGPRKLVIFYLFLGCRFWGWGLPILQASSLPSVDHQAVVVRGFPFQRQLS
jgi:hypothetical protein